MTAVGSTSSASSVRRFATVLVVAAVLVASLGTGVGNASASGQSTSSFSSRLVQLINSARSSHGLRPLTVASGTTSVASSWSSHMARVRSLEHNPNLLYDL